MYMYYMHVGDADLTTFGHIQAFETHVYLHAHAQNFRPKCVERSQTCIQWTPAGIAATNSIDQVIEHLGEQRRIYDASTQRLPSCVMKCD